MQLRCVCRKLNGAPEDRDRKFILSYFVDTDEITIYETHVRNSGILGGRFLEKGKYADSSLTPQSFVEGTNFVVLGHRFLIVEVDQRSKVFVSAQAADPVTDSHTRQNPYEPRVNANRIREQFETRPGLD